MRSGARTAVVGGVFVVVASGVGYGAYNLWNGITGGNDGTGATTTSAAAPRIAGSGPVSAEEAERTAKDFLAAWAKGDEAAAGDLTDDPATATAAVAGFRDRAHVSRAVITPGTPAGTTVPFTVDATVTHEGRSARLAYSSELTVVRGAATGLPQVDWKPSVLHPKLTDGASLRTGEAPDPPVKAVDRKGAELTPEKYPSLKPVLEQLRERYGAEAGGRPGVETWIESTREGVPNQTLLTLAKGVPGALRTTLDADVQAAAERAVKRYPESSVVAVKPSTGEIRAVANNRADAFNAAFEGKQAPGSTMKIVTAALLLERGLVAADRPAECPEDVLYQGRSFHNLDHFALPPGSTFEDSFKRSCNTAFIKLIDDVGDDAALGAEARDVFGIGLDWQTGVVTSDGSVPAESGGVAAAQYIGQGTVQMNVLNVASIAATAKHGSFKQPVIVAPGLGDRTVATASRALPEPVARQLRDMMRATATSGSGAAAMAGVGGDKGAKTGSAEVGGQNDSNSWFAGFSDDLAAAAVVQSGGHGGDAAGPLVASVLKAG
ncbi:penicillin-binding transpeptidase domain-containing protein [Streptomyces sp. NPDC015131]|uniref:penicillin-binding transpeptidase domain-containing protein n=1 Tax=Streptomyces sp. NPDC015131 TaxID=3364941 RepID=UPI0036FE4033